jgi:cytochrome P450
VRELEEAPFVDFFDPDVVADPDRFYAELRERTSVARTPIGATVIHREPVRKLLSDPRLVSSIPALVAVQGVSSGRLFDMITSSVISADGADHTRLRKLVSRAFIPSAAAKHRPVMRELVNELVDGFAASGHCEFVADFADHYPVQVICEVLGVSRDDHEQFARWGDALTYVLSLELGAHIDEVEKASVALSDYVAALVEERRREPRDDLVTDLVQASDGDDRLSNMELLSMIGGLLFAGYDTTRNQLGLAMFTFAGHHDQWALLAKQPERVPKAIDEVMRLAGAVSGVPRIAKEDIEVDGWRIPSGTIVFVSVASANRDTRTFDNPLDFDITASREAHLTFGNGPHFCLGANLARAEMEEALVVLAARLPNLRLDGEASWRMGTGIAGPTRLPLAFDVA